MTNAVRADVTVPVFRDKYAKGWPANPDGEHAVYTPIGVAMSKTFGTDAHFCAYSVPEVQRRLATSKVFAKLSDGLAMILFVVDVDAPEHAAGDEWWAGERDKLSRLLSDHPNGFVFRTRGGYRIVYQLVEPVVLTTPRDAEQWKLRYVAWIEHLTQCYAIVGDKACKDWTRLYRLPRVLRDGEHQDLEMIGDPHAIGTWDVTVELPTQTALTARQPTTENVGTIGTLTHGERHPTMLSLAGVMRRQGADEATIVAALEKFNATRCNPPKPVAELYEIARFVGGKAPARPASSRTYDGSPDDASDPMPKPRRKPRSRIEITTDVDDVIDQAQQALLEAGGVYVRGQRLVHIVRNFGALKWLKVQSGLPMICQVADARLWEMMSASAEWKKYDGRREKFVDAKPPEWAPKTLRARDQWTFPVLDGASDTPVLRPDGTIHDKPGYDAGSRTFYAPGDVTWPTIKAEPTHHDAATALAELAEPFCDFPFVALSDKSAALALILSIIGRSAIDGVWGHHADEHADTGDRLVPEGPFDDRRRRTGIVLVLGVVFGVGAAHMFTRAWLRGFLLAGIQFLALFYLYLGTAPDFAALLLIGVRIYDPAGAIWRIWAGVTPTNHARAAIAADSRQ